MHRFVLALCLMFGTPALAEDLGIKVFREVCLQSAPDFARAEELAQRYVTRFLEFGSGKSGMSADGSLSVQIKPGRECAVTTPDRPDPKALTAEFQTMLFGKPSRRNPVKARYKGKRFVFLHDTRGGEAYVMGTK